MHVHAHIYIYVYVYAYMYSYPYEYTSMYTLNLNSYILILKSSHVLTYTNAYIIWLSKERKAYSALNGLHLMKYLSVTKLSFAAYSII